jgi:hypothetical protein
MGVPVPVRQVLRTRRPGHLPTRKLDSSASSFGSSRVPAGSGQHSWKDEPAALDIEMG